MWPSWRFGGEVVNGAPRVKLPRYRPYEVAFLAPAVIVVILLMAFPIGYTLFLSVHSWTGGLNQSPRFLGIDNYVNLLGDLRFRSALLTTFLFTTTAVVVQTVLGVGIALLLHRPFRGRPVVRTLLLFPLVATPVAVALIFVLLYQPQLGLLNQLLEPLGIGPVEWVANSSLALWSLVIADTWQWTPLIALIVLAGLTALPQWPFEAAAVDGATRLQTVRYVTLPLLTPTIIVAVTLRAIDALKTFDMIMVITGGGPGFATETVNIYAYRTTFQYQQLGYSASLLITFLVVIAAVTFILLSFRRRVELV
jgi:multiple sugar transport system permease protein